MKLGRIKQKIKGGHGFLDHSGTWRKILGEEVEGVWRLTHRLLNTSENDSCMYMTKKWRGG